MRDDEIVDGTDGKLGIDTMARRGIAGRGVLLDVARHFAARGWRLGYFTPELITTDDLESCAQAQGVEVRTGDVLLVRTGWLEWYFSEATPEVREAISDREQLKAPGLGPAEEMAAWLWDHHLAAVAADNPALEVWP